MKNIFKSLPVVLLACLYISCQAQSNTNLDAGAFEKAIQNKENIQLLDVRTPGEYKSGHIANALLADWNDKDEFNRRIAFIDKKKPLYIYCLAGGRSAAAAAKLRSMGYEQVYELKGGTNAWKAAGKPLEGKTTANQMSLEAFNQTIAGSKTVLVDFGAEWCPPCKTMEPVIKSLQSRMEGKFTLVNVDGGNDEDILQYFKVTQLPVFIIFKDGKQVWRKDGVATEKEMEDQLL